MENVEKRVNTNGADIDVYFVSARDNYINLARDNELFSSYLKHTKKYSITGLQYKDDQVLCVKMYTKVFGKKIALKLTSLEMSVEEFKAL